MKILGPCIAAAAMLASATGAQADPLIAFTDNDPSSNYWATVSDSASNWAVQWTQTYATSDVTLSALLARSSSAPAAGNWYVTNAIGAGTTAANVIASGSYATSAAGSSFFNYNGAPRIVLGTGLDFAAGTYYLVFDGQDGSATQWGADTNAHTTIAYAPGFSIDSYYHAMSPTSFAPAAMFDAYPLTPTAAAFVFEMDSAAVPEPASWAMLMVGFGAIGAGLRHRRSKVATGIAFS